MELFYNPERMSETEIKETFVAYQWLVDEIVSIIKRQPNGAGVQHVVIVAPRGMGKTTLLLMLRFTVLSQDLAKRWQPVLFPEESYSVYDLADLWVEVLDHVASETSDVALREEVKKLKEAHPNSSNLEAVALASIKDWRDKNKKRLLLLVDNFDMILEQIGDEKDNASLRDVLMNDGTMMLIGGSTTFFKEARAYDQPLYNLFKIYNLDGLDSDQMEDLLRRRAKIDGVENFEEILRANRSRLRVLEYFTGGNPRLVLMLYRVLTHSDISEVRRGLEKLLDEVTPYYKAKIEALPPQQRKILDQIARISAQTREGLTPTEIASATRLAVNQVSSQLKRLANVGYVRAANIRGRSSYYTLSEPLYAIWHQMRFGRDARQRMNWLIEFLKGWYDAKELGMECQRLQNVFRSYLTAGREKDARDALEHRRYLLEAIEDQPAKASNFEGIVLGYLELSDVDTLKREILIDGDINLLSEETRQRLTAAGLLAEKVGLRTGTDVFNTTDAKAAVEQIEAAITAGNYEEVRKLFLKLETELEQVLTTRPDLAPAWHLKGLALLQKSKAEEASKAFKRAIELDPDVPVGWYRLANVLWTLGRYEEALSSFDQALKLRPDYFEALFERSITLATLGNMEDALTSIKRALAVRPSSAIGWFHKGNLLAKDKKLEEAFKSFQKAVEIDPDFYPFLHAKAWTLLQMGRTKEALKDVDKLLELDPSSADAYFMRAVYKTKHSVEDRTSDLNRAFNLNSSSHRKIVDSPHAKLISAVWAVVINDVTRIRADWQEFIHRSEKDEPAIWLPLASEVIMFVAQAGHWSLAKDLIALANLQDPLFPLARALDFLLKDDEESIEKLSPEVGAIVNEIILAFKSSTGDKNRNIKKRVKRVKASKKIQQQP